MYVCVSACQFKANGRRRTGDDGALRANKWARATGTGAVAVLLRALDEAVVLVRRTSAWVRGAFVRHPWGRNTAGLPR